MAEENELKDEVADFSDGVQRQTSRFLRKSSQVLAAENADFSQIGGFGKKEGYTQEGSDITSTTTTSTSSSTTTTSTSSSTSSSTSTSTTTTA